MACRNLTRLIFEEFNRGAERTIMIALCVNKWTDVEFSVVRLENMPDLGETYVAQLPNDICQLRINSHYIVVGKYFFISLDFHTPHRLHENIGSSYRA